MKKQYKLTQEGIEELEKERDELLSQRGEITERIKSARELGDLTENAEYASAKAEQERAETRIAEIEHILQNVEVITAPRTNHKIRLGSRVKLEAENGDYKEYQIVGTVEADPLEGKISDESPIGRALIGKRVDEHVEIVLPNDVTNYKIVKID